MQNFTALYFALDSTTRTAEKVRALEAYFANAPPADAAWGLYFLTGRKIKRAVNTRLLREWAAVEAGVPLWLLEESYSAVGDFAETLALLLPDPPASANWPLHQVVEERLAPLPDLPPDRQRALVVETWRSLDARQRLVWHKLIGGEFRVGVSATTFGLWEAGELVPVAKAFSGLTDEEIRQVDRFVRTHTLERHGPVRVVKPELVFELHFDRVQLSKRHRSGVAVRFPRMARWRHDKPAAEADQLETLRRLADPVTETSDQRTLF